MRTISKMLMICAFIFSFSTVSFANNHDPNTKTTIISKGTVEGHQAIRSEVMDMIKVPKMGELQEAQAIVSFLVNSDKEIVLLNVRTDSDFIKNYVQKQLNEQNIVAENTAINLPYHLKVTFIQK